MFFEIIIHNNYHANVAYVYANGIRKVIDHLIYKKIINMQYEDIEKMSEETLEYEFIKKGIPGLTIKSLDGVNVKNLENSLSRKTKLEVPKKSLHETPFKHFITQKGKGAGSRSAYYGK